MNLLSINYAVQKLNSAQVTLISPLGYQLCGKDLVCKGSLFMRVFTFGAKHSVSHHITCKYTYPPQIMKTNIVY